MQNSFCLILKEKAMHHTCVKLIGVVMQSQEVIDHGGLSYTPGSKEQHHWLRGNLSIWWVRWYNND